MTQQPTIVYGAGVHPDRIGQFMHDEAKKQFQQAPHLFVCYLPRKPCDEYAAIKVSYLLFRYPASPWIFRTSAETFGDELLADLTSLLRQRFGDQEVGVATQCLAIPKVKRGNPQCAFERSAATTRS